MKTVICISLFAALVSWTTQAEIYSYLFKDVITSKGTGNINLLTPRSNTLTVNGTLLEAFRQDNNGKLVFAVDVNEASDGSENGDSQGLAIKQAQLFLTIAGEEYIYDQVSTRTQVLLQEQGSSNAQLYYSLIGVAGSALRSPYINSELSGTSIDSTLSFAIDRDLSQLSAARLEIRLLNTDSSLGDPERFYDYSNGFDEIALLTAGDVAYLDGLARGVSYAPMVILDGEGQSLLWSYYPASDAFYVVAFEDLYPAKGDYDFNDLVVAYQLKVGNDTSGNVNYIRGNGYLIARGAEYDHDFYLGLTLPSEVSGTYSIAFYNMQSTEVATGFPRSGTFSGRTNLQLSEHIADAFYDGPQTYVNTFAEQSIVQGPRFEFELVLDAPTPFSIAAQAPFDPFIFVHDTQYEIHTVNNGPVLPFSDNVANGYSQFRDENGFPFAMILNEQWMPPLAGVDMGVAYPLFMEHVNSQGSKQIDWYSNPENNKIKSIPFRSWQW